MHARPSSVRVRPITAIALSVCLLGGAAGVVVGSASFATADTRGPIDFEGYATGTLNGQDDWVSTGPFDQEVSDNSLLPGAPPAFGAQSFRISDSYTSGSFGDQTFSPFTADAAGEPTADANGYPVGSLQTSFRSSFDFASVTPGAEQPGLHTTASPDRGDGARMSFVRIDDTATGWNLTFSEYKDVAPLGSGGDLDDGCGAGDSFVPTVIASSVSRAVPHNLQIVMNLVPGAHNDIVTVLLDDVVVHTGTSWEDYFRYCAESGGGTGGPLADQSRIVRNVLFRQAGTANPANAGAGFLIDNLEITTASVPDAPTIGSATAGNAEATVSWTAPGFDGGAAITAYVVTPYIGAAPQPAQTFNSPATSQTVTGLTNGTAYTFTVAATNMAGTGPESASSNAVTPVAPPLIVSSCKNTQNQSAEMGMYPANPGSQSSLKVSCLFESDVDSPAYMVPSAFTVHDFEVSSYHNGAARTVTNSAAVASGASSFQIGATAGATLSSWVNRAITGPGIAPHTFVTAITPGGQVNLSELTTAAVAAGIGSYKIDNASVRSIDSGAVSGSTLSTAPGVGTSANFTAADVGLSVSGTLIPANTVVATFIDADTVTLSNAAMGAGSSQVIAIGDTSVSTSARTVSDAVRSSATRVETVAGRNSSAFDVGLPVYGPGIAAGAVITSVTGAGSKNLNLGGECAPTCVTTVNASPVTIVIGDPTGTAPNNGDTVASLGLQLDVSPTLIPGSQACSQEAPEGFQLVGGIYNPGSFQTPVFAATIPSNVRVVGQILFDTATSFDFAAYIVQRPALSAGDPTLGEHYDVVFPNLPVSLAMCGGAAPDLGYDSPGLGVSLTVFGQTASQARMPSGSGRPGTAHLRAVQPSVGGYLSSIFLDSQAGPTLSPAANFTRLCVYPAGGEVRFTCGNG